MLNIKDLEPNYLVYMEMKNGKLSMNCSGNTTDLMIALSTLVNKFKNNGIPEDLIKSAVKIGLLTEEQLKDKTEKTLDKLFDNLFKI